MVAAGCQALAGGKCLCSPAGWEVCQREVLDATSLGMMDVEILTATIVSFWDSPPVHIPHQRDEGALAHVISYLDEKVTCQPMCKAWDEFVWPPPSSAPLQHLGEMSHLASYRDGQWNLNL